MSSPPATPDPGAPAPRRYVFLVHWLMLACALLLLGAQISFDQLASRERIERTASEQLANHSLVLAEELQRRLHSIDVVLQKLRLTVSVEITHPNGLEHVMQELQTLTQAIEGVRTLLVFDAAGNIVASNRPELVGRNFAQREYFQTQQQQPQPDRLHMGPPFTTILGVFTVNLTRAIYGPQGEFSGLVSATLDADGLRALLLSLHASENTRLSVVHGSGTLLSLIPERMNIKPGTNVDKPGSFYRRHMDSGQAANLMRGVSGALGTESFMSMRTVQPGAPQLDAPLIVAAARDRDDILAEWREQLYQRIAFFLLATAITTAALRIYQQHQRRFDLEMREKEDARRRSVAVLQGFIDNLPGTAYVKDADSRTLMANRGFQTVLGMDPASMIGKTSLELFPGEFGEQVTADDRKVLESGKTVSIEESFDGRDYESIKFVIDDGSGQPQLGGVTLDITPRKQAERDRAAQLEHLRELNKKLEEAQYQLLQSEKMASLGQLAAGVAHELNNPIGFVHSNLGTLETYLQDVFEVASACEDAACRASNPADFAAITQLKQSKDFDFLRQDIFQLMAESKDGLARVKKIVQDLKDFSRPGETEWKLADLHAGLDSTLNIIWNELKYKCTVTKDYGTLPPVRCLLAQLNQVFMNLLVNAAHAIPEKGEITIRTGQQGDEVFVAISDTGNGIPEENLTRIFEPFFTTKPIGKGTGLGLSLAYGIVQKHQGRIEVQSEPGKGSTFTVWLPVAQPEATPVTG